MRTAARPFVCHVWPRAARFVASGFAVVLFALALPSHASDTVHITTDRVSVQKQVWGLFCGEGKKPTTRRGKAIQATLTPQSWRVPLLSLGAQQCQGLTGPLQVKSSGKSGASWRTTCASAKVTQGTETVTTTFTPTADGARIRWESAWYFRKEGDDCKQRTVRTVTLSRTAQPAQTACKRPGPPKRLTLSPKLRDVKAGQTACLKAKLVDAEGCTVPFAAGLPPAFSVEPASAARVDAGGCVAVGAAVPESLLGVVVRAAGFEAEAALRVVPRGQKRAKKRWRNLAGASRNKRVRRLVAAVAPGDVEITPLSREEKVHTTVETTARWPWAVFAAVLLVGLAAGVLMWRRRRAPSEPPLEAAPVQTPDAGHALVCPVCALQFKRGEHTTCPHDGVPLLPLGQDARQTMFVPAIGGMVCPVCHQKYPTKARFCGHDAAPLVPDAGQYGAE